MHFMDLNHSRSKEKNDEEKYKRNQKRMLLVKQIGTVSQQIGFYTALFARENVRQAVKDKVYIYI